MDVFIARQPIFDRHQQVVAYELLYRDSERNAAVIDDPDRATTTVFVNSFMELGLERVLDRLPGYINMSRPLLLGEVELPRTDNPVILEVLEDIAPDEELLEALRWRRREGYRIALDDFHYAPEFLPLLDLADVVKLDVRALGADGIEEHARRLWGYPGLTLLAEKVETPEEFEHCAELGFDLFQGYFFCKPKILRGRRADPGQLAVLELMGKLNDPDFRFGELAAIVERDVSLSYKLLRFVNSAYFNLPRRIDSVQHALVILGRANVRVWMSLIALSQVEGKPHQLLVTSLTRARMCQRLAERLEWDSNPDTYFLAGLFAAIDAFVDMPKEDVVPSLSLAKEIEKGILHGDGPIGRVLDLVLHSERADWDGADLLGLSAQRVNDLYVEAVRWAGQAADAIRE
ncbi:MAG TPA: HDOD domain-containing protein [Gammaproteobacteria bacterium]|nr:HDOD domain-containing protein [Gammaproteobacteria bacterium]